MGKDKGFRTIQELVSALTDAERGMSSGALHLEGLETACTDARELYERLVVLRHKAREAALAPATKAAAPELPPEPIQAEEPSVAAEPPTLRLDTRPPVISPRQTSLIEAIEATDEEEEPVKLTPVEVPVAAAVVEAPAPAKAEKKESAKQATTVAEKLEKASISDLSKAISLSHKFWFVAELFGGDRITYDKSIGLLNALGDKEKAIVYMETEVLTKLKKPADPEALAIFMDLIERRYP
ncbi:MAG: hypothetical protein WEC15_06690 [Flavobacteriales bacterium]